MELGPVIQLVKQDDANGLRRTVRRIHTLGFSKSILVRDCPYAKWKTAFHEEIPK